MAFLMINQHVWASLTDTEREQIRSAGEVRLGEMPLWIDVRDHSRWLVAGHSRTSFEENIGLIEAFAPGAIDNPSAFTLDRPPDWAREATDSERAEIEQPDPAQLDIGVLLLQPVTLAETRSVEAILTQLWAAIETDQLEPAEAAQIKAMATTLKVASTEFEPGRTERWKVVGAVRAVLRPAFKVAQGLNALDLVLDVVTDTGWTQLASELTELVP